MDDEIGKILRETKTIAVVGLSPKTHRPSYGVTKYIMAQGYKIIPVNPGHKEILGQTCFKSLLDIKEPVDMVNVFRRSEAVPEIVDQAIQINAKFIWMQEGVFHPEAAEKARQKGLRVVMDRCLYKDHAARHH